MNVARKKYVSIALILGILSLMLHSHSHFNNCPESFNVVVVPEPDIEHHISNECDKCKSKTNKIENKRNVGNTFKNPTITCNYKAQDNNYSFILFKLYSRPPPIFIS